MKVKKTFKLVWYPGVQEGVLLDRLVSILVLVQLLIGSSRAFATTLVALLRIFVQTASSVLTIVAAVVALLLFDPHPNHQHLSPLLIRLRQRFANPAFGSFAGTFHVRYRTLLLL